MYRLLLPLSVFAVSACTDHLPEPKSAPLYLTSAAINVLDELVPMLPEQDGENADCYIVTAGNPHENPHWIADEINAIRDAGRAIRPIDLAELSKGALDAAFDGCGVIWAGGGNTFYLLQEVRRSGFDELLTLKIASGIPYVGTSAGSIILAPNIGAVRFADDLSVAPDLASFDGLGLFPLVVFAHFDSPQFKDVYREILAHALEDGVDFVTLKERQFIVVDGDRWRMITAESR